MIVAVAEVGSGKLLLLGLDGENVTRLAAGEPILLGPSRLRQLGVEGLTVQICYGRTPEDILAAFRSQGIDMQDLGDPGPG
jgi:hypothetical protein